MHDPLHRRAAARPPVRRLRHRQSVLGEPAELSVKFGVAAIAKRKAPRRSGTISWWTHANAPVHPTSRRGPPLLDRSRASKPRPRRRDGAPCRRRGRAVTRARLGCGRSLPFRHERGADKPHRAWRGGASGGASGARRRPGFSLTRWRWPFWKTTPGTRSRRRRSIPNGGPCVSSSPMRGRFAEDAAQPRDPGGRAADRGARRRAQTPSPTGSSRSRACASSSSIIRRPRATSAAVWPRRGSPSRRASPMSAMILRKRGLTEALEAGRPRIRNGAPSCFLVGVTPYLTEDAVFATLVELRAISRRSRDGVRLRQPAACDRGRRPRVPFFKTWRPARRRPASLSAASSTRRRCTNGRAGSDGSISRTSTAQPSPPASSWACRRPRGRVPAAMWFGWRRDGGLRARRRPPDGRPRSGRKAELTKLSYRRHRGVTASPA